MNIGQQIIIKNIDNSNYFIEALPLISSLYKTITRDQYLSDIKEMISLNNFKMIAAFQENKIISVAGYWVSKMLYCKRYLQVSSFVVDENIRGTGVGGFMLKKLENIALELDCDKIVLDSYTENKKSHSLYFRENFYIRGFHFMKDLKN